MSIPRAAAVFAVFVLLTAVAPGSFADDPATTNGTQSSGASQGGADQHTPQPYTPEEFPQWTKDLVRGNIIAVGSLPFTFFLTLEVYDTFRYFNSSMDLSYAPWPFRTGTTTYSDSERAWLVVSAITSSLIIAGVDFLIGRWNESNEKR